MPPHGKTLRELAHPALALATSVLFSCAIALCLWKLRAGTNLNDFNSDTAIPVLMANDRRWDVFQCFYWGQDRFGAWPFLLARLVSIGLGGAVRWEHLQFALAAWFLLGAIALAWLFPASPGLATFFYLAPPLLMPELRLVFDLSQPYGWQLAALALAWWRLRVVLESESSASRSSLFPRALRWLAVLSASTLATWMSPVSGPMLLGLGLLESWRLALTRTDAARRRLAMLSLIPAIGAAAFEMLLRRSYHAFAKQHYDWDFHTEIQPEWTGVAEKAGTVFRQLLHFEMRWLLIVSALGCLAAILLLLLCRRLPDGGGVARSRIAVDAAFLTLGAGWMAASQLPLFVLIAHFRINEFDLRYFAPTFFFGSVAGLASLVGVAAVATSHLPAYQRWSSALSAAFVLALVLWLPKPVASATYACQKRIASELARRAPGAVLLSHYWDTYAISALQERALRPLSFDGQCLRNPWMVLELKSAAQVIVGHQGGTDAAVPRPEPVITQYGTKLYQVKRDWYGECGRSYSLYTSLAPSEK